MAAVSQTQGAFTTTAGSKAFPSLTPAVGDLIIVITAHTGNTSAATPTDNNADGLGTYTQITAAACVKATSADQMRVFVRNALIGSATATVVTHNPGTTTGGGGRVLAISGMSKVGSAAVRQAAKQDNQAAAGTPAPVLGAAALTANLCLAAVFNASNTSAVTGPSGFTQLADQGYNSPAAGARQYHRASGFTGTTVTFGSTSATAFCSCAVELDTSAPATITPSGGIEPEGDLVKAVSRNLSGGVTPTGALAKAIAFLKGGGITPSGALDRILVKTKALAGGITPTGSLVRAAGKVLTGTITPTGVTQRSVSRFFGGGVIPVGLLSAAAAKLLLLAGAIQPSGTLTRQGAKVLSGAITPQGTATKRTSKALSGSLTPSGALTKGSSRAFSGSITPAGTLRRAVQKFLAGTIGPSGALTTLFTPGAAGNVINVAGGIVPVGTLVRAVSKNLSGSVTPTGTLARTLVKLRSFAGSITPTGALRRAVTKNLGGGILPSGSLSTFSGAGIFLAGAIAPTGTLIKAVSKRLAGGVTPSGLIRKDAAIFLAGAIIPTGLLDLFTQGVEIIGSVWGGIVARYRASGGTRAGPEAAAGGDRSDVVAGGTRGEDAAGGTRSASYASGGDRRSDG